MAIINKGLNAMIDGIGQVAGKYLIAIASGSNTEYAGAVTYDAASGGVADIAASVAITIPSGETITSVVLSSAAVYSIGNTYASKTISAYFPDGGDLIIEGYQMTVTSTDA